MLLLPVNSKGINLFKLQVWGCSEMTSSFWGAGGICQMMTLDDLGGSKIFQMMTDDGGFRGVCQMMTDDTG